MKSVLSLEIVGSPTLLDLQNRGMRFGIRFKKILLFISLDTRMQIDRYDNWFFIFAESSS